NSILIDLGLQPISNALISDTEEFTKEKTYPLVVFVCDACGLVQLNNEIDRALHFNGNYTYYSSYSTSWLEHAKNLAEKTINELQLTSEELVVEIASNDGYLLQYFKNAGVRVIGFEPSENVAAEAISLRNIPTRVEFFGIKAAEKLRLEQEAPKLILGINVLAHVPDLHDFLGGIEILLDIEGRAILEFPHLLNILSEFQFDTIYHEHYSYLSLSSLNPIVGKCGLKIVGVEKIDTHGGSLRVQLAKIGSKESVPHELNRIILEELAMDPRDPIVRKEFQDNVSRIVQELSIEIDRLNKSGKRVIGYGAAAKGNTILNLAKIDAAQIEYVIDKNPFKQGKFLPGSHIPIYGTQELETNPPDVILILPWNLSSEIREQLRARGIYAPILKAIPKLGYLE
ncbi:MAG: class I SAM-dependent methyltransferase, partial [Proteobacteria bacterium]|nr:class I SAM-dependent methyltransferase [Pseudomonadota bacterium]